MTRKTITATLVIAGAVLLFSVMAAPASAQDISVVAPTAESGLSMRVVQLFVLVTVLSMAPGIAMMVTCLPFMVIVFSFMRQAIGVPQAPPNMMIMALAMFLTFFVMEPVFTDAWENGISPLMHETLDVQTALMRSIEPFRGFMAARVDPDTFRAMADLRPGGGIPEAGAQAPLSVLIPSFLLSEIARAFQIGFLVFLPFLIIDLVVAAILMSMGMMMVPPAIVSLPFKLSFFVVADGWSLIAGALVRSYAP